MKMNSSGKVVTIFIAIFVVLLISLTAISMFYLQQESKIRREAESQLEKAKTQITSLEGERDGLKKDKFVLEAKNKEADDRINDLSSELDLEKGLREQMKTENTSLKSQLDQEKQANAVLQGQFDKQSAELQKTTSDLQTSLKENQDNEARAKTAEQAAAELKEKMAKMEEGFAPTNNNLAMNDPVSQAKQTVAKDQVQLDKIVVSPKQVPEGRVLSVDTETEFVIINLGEKDGVRQGDLLAVYRGKDYLGDIKVTRLQAEMAAADLLPPFSSKLVRKNDQVVSKTQ
ncbi:MAG: hypothetical protein HQL24_00190 [Candidatus Omnitrophica bacterium]|nr:hypothetical protein [Candidatus Omnitrophota bacterium]